MAMTITTAMSVFGQNGFSYQAVIRNAEGELITNKQVEVKFTLKHNDKDYYTETQSVSTNEYGNIQVMVGEGTKLDGSFNDVPWNTLDIKMAVAVDVEGSGKFLTIGETPIQSAPYAMFAQKAGGYSAQNSVSKDGDALFAVNDANGNPVFAVFANGIVVYVDDTDSNSNQSKAVRSGFVVIGRSATKDKAATEYFSVTTEGTQIYVDNAGNQDDKAMRSGFVVTGRSATKDGQTANYLTIGGEGTTIFVDDDSSKAMRSGFVVTGRTATKDGQTADYLTVGGENTTIYVDDNDKAMRSGFVVTGRSATKDGADNYLAVDGNGTQVYVDGAEENKAMRSGFVVTGRSATKDDEKIFAIEGGYTRVYIDDDEADKAKRSGFVVTGRSASKDTATTNYLDINKDSINFLATEFNVVERVAETSDTTAQPEPGDTTTTPAPVVPKPKSLFTINSGSVQIGTDMVMVGEVVKQIEADTISTDTIETEFPQIAKIVDRADTISCTAYKPFVYGNDNDNEGYALLGIYSKGKYAKITTTDARNNTVLLIDASGNITKKQKSATVAVLMPEGDNTLYIRPLKATSQTISFGLMKKNATEPYQYIKIEAEIEASAGVPYKVTTSNNEGGRVVIDGTLSYGDKPTFEAVPQVGYAFVRWSDGSTQAKHPVTIIDDFDISAEFERISYVVAAKSGNELFGTVSGEGTYWHGDTAYIVATPFTGYYFNNWSGIELNDSLQNSPSLALEVTSNLKLIANFGIMQYTITFDTDGGSNVTAITQDYNTKITAPAAPQKEGFRFRGWSDTIPERMPAENLTIKAIWGINKYFITVNTNNGAPVDSLAFDFDEAVTAPDDPKREGYTFAGWDNAFPEKMPAEDLIITAQWKVNSHYILYMVEDTVYKTDSALYGTTIELIAGPGKKGYKFDEWLNVPKTMPDTDVTITASFTAETYSITYIMNDGNWVEGKKGQEEYTVEDKIYLPAPTKENYNFLGWLYADSTTVQNIAGDTTGNLTLTANWTPSPYIITYELNDGILEGNNPTGYNVETETFTLNNPIRIGYIFDGWTENGLPSASTVITIEKGSSGNRNFIATWKDSTYTITYDGIAGIEIENPTTYTISSNDIKLANPTKTNYEFIGWEGTGLSSASTEVTIAKGSTGNRSYTATWKAISYNIAYEPDGGTMPTGDYALNFTVEDNVTLPIPTMPHYSFNGWYDASGNLVDGWKAGDKTAPVTLTAQWEKSFEDIEGFSHYGPTYGSRVLNCYAQVTLQNYIACNHEVTQAEYKAIMGVNPSRFNGEDGFEPAESEIQSRRPVDSVSWFDAIYYCNLRSIAENLTPCYKVGNENDPTKWGYTPHNGDTIAATITCNFEVDGYRLPTEAEWEYIAIAGDPQLSHEGNYSYYYGDITSLWYNGNSDGKTHEVKKYATNDYGIYDLEGNVREWCWDWYHEYGWDRYIEMYGTESDTCTNRVIRGGGWNSNKSDCDIFECYYGNPDARYGDCGFRVVRTAISDTKCTITYNTTGGTLIEPHTVWNGYYISSLPVPSRENYAFDGWYMDDEYTTPFDFEMYSVVTQDITLYTKWIWYKDGIRYDITDANAKNCQISSVDKSLEGAFEIPETVKIEGVDYTITRIGNGAFSNCRDITSITIPNTVTSIGERAFYFVEKEGGLTSLEIPESVTSIGSEAFYGCHYLERITLPSGITSIGDRWFCDCWHLKSINGSEDGTIVIPEGITSIGSNSFRNCQYDLKSVIIPEGVTNIGDHAFYDCKALESLSVPSSVEFVGTAAFPTYSDNQLPNHYNIADDGAKYLGNDENPYVVLIDGKSVTNLVIKDGCRFIYEYACSNLNGTNVTSVQFPEGLKGIGESAFIWGKIEGDINIPEGVTNISGGAFFRCSKVQTFSVPNSVTSIGEDAFTFALYEDEYATLGENLYTRDGNALYLGNETNPYLCLAGTTSKDITECTINSQCKFILNKAFYGCTSLILDVPETVSSIASNAFSGVRNINYNGPAGNAYDTWGAIVRNGHIVGDFIYSSADRTILLGYFGGGTEVVIPNTATTISRNAFKGLSSLTSVTIPNSVTAIGSGAFNGCTGIRSLTIPDEVETIDYNYNDGYAFEGVGNINYNGPAIDLNKNNWGAATRNAIVVGDFIFEDDAHTKLIKYIGNGGVVEIPPGTVTIGEKVFNDCDGITSVNIPTTVESIGDYAFYGCSNLESVSLSSVKSIGYEAFSFCTKLTSITIPESVESIGSEAFYYCNKLETINILSSGTRVGSDAFKKCEQLRYGYANFASYESLCSLQFEGGDGLANPLSMAKKLYIGGEAVTEVVIPDGITTIGRQTFFNAKNITSVSIPASVTNIGDEAFRGCSSLTTITGANGLQNIGYKAFNECKFAQFEVPTSVTSISNNAFDNCQSLSAIYIPANVTTMGSDVFLACNSSYLKVYCEAPSKPEGWADEWNHWNNSKEMTVIWGVTRNANGFLFKNSEIIGYTGNITENPTIPATTPDGTSVTTIGNKVFCWSNISSINIPSTITCIGDSAFYGSGKLTSVTISEGVTSIGRAAFCGCYSLTTINIPEGITSIADSLFCGCDALQQITFPSSVTSIGKMAFRYCHFTSFEIPSTVKTIGEGAFYACYYMTSVTISEGVTSIGDYAFWSCDDLTSVTIPSTVTSIGESAFYDCELLASVTINDGVESIGNRAFQSCDILASVNIPSSVTSIGEMAFNYCPKLTSVNISESVTSIGEEAFSHCDNLKEVHFKNNTPPANVGDNPFSNCSKAALYVPKGSGDAYKETSWADGITVYEEDPLSQNMLYIKGMEVSGAVNYSHVFIADRTVTINNLYACDHEVTQGEFNNVMLDNPSSHTGDNFDNYPVERVNWYAAIAYCNKLSALQGLDSAYTVKDKNGAVVTDWANFNYSKLPSGDESWTVTLDITKNGYRLPTEAEWEYLARGGSLLSTFTYSGSNTIGDVAWHGGNSGSQTHEVKQKNRNGAGLCDMSGNVWEWCWDWFGTIDSTTPATGVETGTVHVLRGGSCFNNVDNDEPDKDELSVYYTDGLQNNPSRYGFRVVRTVVQ